MWIDFSQKKADILSLKSRFSKDWQQAIFSFLEEWYNQDSFILLRTSGTTAKPKKISVKKQYMSNSACMSIKFFELSRGQTALLCLSPQYIAGKMMLVRSAISGLHLYCTPPCSRPLKNLQSPIDFSAMVPLQLYHSFGDLHYISKLLIGGAPITLAMENDLDKVDNHSYASYGMTETLSHIALRKINGPNKSQWYTILPGVQIETDHRRCLKVFSPFLMDTPFQTNDIVNIQSSSRFKWIGRYDYLINSGGIKIIPEQWESKIRKFISRRFFLSSLADEALGEKLIMILEGKPFDVKIPGELFKNENYLYKPKEIYFVQRFSETSSGKIQRKKTLDQLTRSIS